MIYQTIYLTRGVSYVSLITTSSKYLEEQTTGNQFQLIGGGPLLRMPARISQHPVFLH